MSRGFYSMNGAASAQFHGGTRCVAGPVRRTTAVGSGGNDGPDVCSGTFAFDFATRASTGADPGLTVGTLVCCQVVFRDPSRPTHVGPTDALEFTLLP